MGLGLGSGSGLGFELELALGVPSIRMRIVLRADDSGLRAPVSLPSEESARTSSPSTSRLKDLNHSEAASSLKVSPLRTSLPWPVASLSQVRSGTAVEVGSQNCELWG